MNQTKLWHWINQYHWINKGLLKTQTEDTVKPLKTRSISSAILSDKSTKI